MTLKVIINRKSLVAVHNFLFLFYCSPHLCLFINRLATFKQKSFKADYPLWNLRNVVSMQHGP